MSRAVEERSALLSLRKTAVLALCVSALLGAGCKARPYKGAPLTDNFLVTVQNQGADIHQLEVDYPEASFGRDTLPSGAVYHYQPKIIGSGPIKITFNDNQGKSHSATGPSVQTNDRKSLLITIGQDESISFAITPTRAQ